MKWNVDNFQCTTETPHSTAESGLTQKWRWRDDDADILLWMTLTKSIFAAVTQVVFVLIRSTLTRARLYARNDTMPSKIGYRSEGGRGGGVTGRAKNG